MIRPIKALKDRIPNAIKMGRGLMLKAARTRSERMKRGWEMKTT